MLELKNKEDLYAIKGGAFSFGFIGSFISGVIFIIGLIDGYTRPLKCRRV